MLNRIFSLALAVSALGVLGCSDDEPIFPLEPAITFVSFTPDTVTSDFSIDGEQEDLTLTLNYTDGDGDLGAENEQDTTNFNFFLKDLRENHPDGFDGLIRGTMPSLTADARNPSIQGQITFSLPVGLVNYNTDGSLDSTRFELWVLDRAGNESNHDTTDVIYIRP